MRAFLGTFLNESNQAFYRALVGRVMGAHPGVMRRIPDASAHLTWVFIGELADAQGDAVRVALTSVAARHGAIPIQLGPPRVLAAGPTPRLVCADVSRGAEEVRRLAEDLAAGLRAALPDATLDLMKGPHVTLARFRRQATRGDGRAVAATLATPAFATATAGDRLDSVQLVASTLAPGGSVYTVVGECPLG
jgi:RNA 2',3'-cyclic 3'-phosphodiesterase